MAAVAGDVPVPAGTRFSRFAPVRRYRVSLGVFASNVAAAPSARATHPVRATRSAGLGLLGWGVPGVGFPRSSGGGGGGVWAAGGACCGGACAAENTVAHI